MNACATPASNHTDEGIRIAHRLRLDHPAIRVVVLSPGASAPSAVRLFTAGACGRAYLLTGRLASGDELVAAVRAVAAGGTVVDPGVVDALVGAQGDSEESLLVRLTARELEVLSLLAEGHANARIADQLGLTRRAVEKHVGEIFSRLGLDDDLEVSRRVTAALVYLREAGRSGPGATAG